MEQCPVPPFTPTQPIRRHARELEELTFRPTTIPTSHDRPPGKQIEQCAQDILAEQRAHGVMQQQDPPNPSNPPWSPCYLSNAWPSSQCKNVSQAGGRISIMPRPTKLGTATTPRPASDNTSPGATPRGRGLQRGFTRSQFADLSRTPKDEHEVVSVEFKTLKCHLFWPGTTLLALTIIITCQTIAIVGAP